jgi:hypothetical protein
MGRRVGLLQTIRHKRGLLVGRRVELLLTLVVESQWVHAS